MAGVVYSKSAFRILSKMAAKRQATIRAKINQYAADPDSLKSNVTKLKGRPGYRLRIGGDRVIFIREGDTITVLAIGPRGSVY